MINSGIREFEDKIIQTFNDYELPIEVKRLVAQNTLNLITKKADEMIMQEIRDEKQEDYMVEKEEK